jgi:hypothetical protein
MFEVINLPNLIITKNLISQSLFKQVIGAYHDPSIYKDDNMPVHAFSNHEVYMFCNKLSEIYNLQPVYEAWKTLEGLVYEKNHDAKGIRLLTLDEWMAHKDLFKVEEDFNEKCEEDIVGNPLLLTGFRVCQSK